MTSLIQLPKCISASPIVRRTTRSRHRFSAVCLALALTLAALSPNASAVSPPPEGGYPGQNTAEGEDALFSLTTGEANTAIGYQALYSNTEGTYNVALGT